MKLNKNNKKNKCFENKKTILQSLLIAFFMFFLFLPIFPITQAANLGVWGSVYPIEEEDFLVFIKERLKHLEKTGELEKLKKQFIQNAVSHTLRPSPVLLTTTNLSKTFYYDPTFTVTRDILDSSGNTIIAKGTTVNPLDKIRMHSVLFFFDADDDRQLALADKVASSIEQGSTISNIKLILTNGDVRKTSYMLSRHVYFDQNGILSKKLGFRHIPSIVLQAGNKLAVKEIAINSIGHPDGLKNIKNKELEYQKKVQHV